MPFGVNYVRETTIFREYGPLSGDTMSLGLRIRAERRQPAVAPARSTATPATTCGSAPTACWRSARRGYKSWGEFPGYLYFGGNSEMRGYDYLEFLGNKAFFPNAELRFPLIEAALTPIGVVGGLRGVFFFNMGAAGYEGAPMTSRRSEPITVHAAARLPARIRRRRASHAGFRPAADDLRVPAAWTAARRTASASRHSRSDSRSTSTGRGGRSSTRTGRTTCSPTRAPPRGRPAASGSARRSSASGSGTISKKSGFRRLKLPELRLWRSGFG